MKTIRLFITILSDIEQLVIDKERGLIQDGKDYRMKLNNLGKELRGLVIKETEQFEKDSLPIQKVFEDIVKL